MTEVEKILLQEGVTEYEVLEDKYERGFHRVTVRKPDGRTLQVNVPETSYTPTKDYEVVEEKHENGCKKVTIKLPNGSKANLTIPDHTEEEEAKIWSNFARATFKMLFPNDDWSNTRLKIIT